MVSPSARATTRALLSRWRDSARYNKAFDAISGWVASALRIKDKLSDFSAVHSEEGSPLVDVMSFEAVEQRIIVDLSSAIPQATPAEYAALSCGDIAAFRRLLGIETS